MDVAKENAIGPLCVAEIVRIELNVADLERSVAFYVHALGFAEAAPAIDRRGRLLRLGEQEIALRQAPPDARAYPTPRRANDPWFQHFAIAVSDMASAYAILNAHDPEPISRGGPQLLPPSTGSVTAYKFRDPDGHPLELSYVPGGPWSATGAHPQTPFRGIDHTALATPDLEASVAFYEALGFQVFGRFLNRGPEQDRLDGLDGVVLDIVALSLPAGGPHIELLAYRSPKSALAGGLPGGSSSDIAKTRTLLRATCSVREEEEELTDPAGHVLEITG